MFSAIFLWAGIGPTPSLTALTLSDSRVSSISRSRFRLQPTSQAPHSVQAYMTSRAFSFQSSNPSAMACPIRIFPYAPYASNSYLAALGHRVDELRARHIGMVNPGAAFAFDAAAHVIDEILNIS